MTLIKFVQFFAIFSLLICVFTLPPAQYPAIIDKNVQQFYEHSISYLNSIRNDCMEDLLREENLDCDNMSSDQHQKISSLLNICLLKSSGKETPECNNTMTGKHCVAKFTGDSWNSYVALHVAVYAFCFRHLANRWMNESSNRVNVLLDVIGTVGADAKNIEIMVKNSTNRLGMFYEETIGKLDSIIVILEMLLSFISIKDLFTFLASVIFSYYITSVDCFRAARAKVFCVLTAGFLLIEPLIYNHVPRMTIPLFCEHKCTIKNATVSIFYERVLIFAICIWMLIKSWLQYVDVGKEIQLLKKELEEQKESKITERTLNLFLKSIKNSFRKKLRRILYQYETRTELPQKSRIRRRIKPSDFKNGAIE